MEPEFRSASPESLARVRALANLPVARDLFKIETVTVEAGRVVLAVDCRLELGHREGWFQGSITTALAEFAAAWSGMTLIDIDWRAVTLAQSISFVGAARGDRLIAEGRVVHIESTKGVCAADVFVEYNGERELVATMQQTNHYRPPKD